MYSCYLRFGKTSYEWQESIDILKIVTKSLAPLDSHDDWKSLKSSYLDITHTVEEKLQTTKQNKEKAFLAISNLKRHYEASLEGSEYYQEAAKTESVSIKDSVFADMSNDELSPVEKLAKSSETKLSELPDYVKPDVWFKIFTGEGQPPRRLKLSLITPETAQMVFVDRKGTKVIEKDVNTFCEELQSSKSVMLEDHSVFDHALCQVISHIASGNK